MADRFCIVSLEREMASHWGPEEPNKDINNLDIRKVDPKAPSGTPRLKILKDKLNSYEKV